MNETIQLRINTRSKALRIALCLMTATLAALTAHIYVAEWTRPILMAATSGLKFDPSEYPPAIMFSAYGTAFVTVGLVLFLYYHTQHLLAIKSKLLKAIVVACIMLELKGDLFRQPFMDFLLYYINGIEAPVTLVILNQADKWVANLLLGLCLVYWCPKKDSKR